jgi:hypothetical protein
MIGGPTDLLLAGGLLFTAKFRGTSITVGHATAAELADIAERPTSKVVGELARWGVVANRSSPGGRRTTLHAVGWQRSQASPWVTSPLREVTLGPIIVGTISGQAYRLVGKPEDPLGDDLTAAVAENLESWGLEEINAVARRERSSDPPIQQRPVARECIARLPDFHI